MATFIWKIKTYAVTLLKKMFKVYIWLRYELEKRILFSYRQKYVVSFVVLVIFMATFKSLFVLTVQAINCCLTGKKEREKLVINRSIILTYFCSTFVQRSYLPKIEASSSHFMNSLSTCHVRWNLSYKFTKLLHKQKIDKIILLKL